MGYDLLENIKMQTRSHEPVLNRGAHASCVLPYASCARAVPPGAQGATWNVMFQTAFMGKMGANKFRAERPGHVISTDDRATHLRRRRFRRVRVLS